MMRAMSELDVIMIHIRADQAAEYKRLFAERELPRWREYKARGAFLSARISRVAVDTDDRQGGIKYAVAVEVPRHAPHSEHDADPGFQEFKPTRQPPATEEPLAYRGKGAARRLTAANEWYGRARLRAPSGRAAIPPSASPCAHLARSPRRRVPNWLIWHRSGFLSG